MKAYNASKGKKETMEIEKFIHIVRTEDPLLDELIIFNISTTADKVFIAAYAAQDQISEMMPEVIAPSYTVFSNQVRIEFDSDIEMYADQGYQVTIEVMIVK